MGVNRVFRRELVVSPEREGLPIRSKEMKMKSSHTICLLSLILVIAGSALAQEKKIKRSELPAAVEATVVEQSKGATIRGFNEEKKKGQTTYEVEMLVNGHSKDVQMDASGAVIEIEEQVDSQALPAEVRAGLQAKAGNDKIAKIESITKKGKLVAYEAQVVTEGKKSEVQVGPEGNPLDHEE
jgi:hypothetical protein